MAETPQGSIVVVADMGARSPGEEVLQGEVRKTGVGLVLRLGRRGTWAWARAAPTG